MKRSVVILGINGHIGQAAARAFTEAGWVVTGFGREERHPITGVRFVAGDAGSVSQMADAIGPHQMVLNALNLPYDQWDRGRAEAQLERVIAATGAAGRTLLFPGNIYNYAADQALITPETAPRPERERGAIRVRMEKLLAEASARGDLKPVILRAGDFYGPHSRADWFDQMILREAGKGKVALPRHEIPHCWAYLPDLARAFVLLAEREDAPDGLECFHFAGHFVSSGETMAAIERAAGRPLKRVPMPWGLIRAMGLVMPVMREVAKMRYLWDHPMRLADPRLEALLGPGFGTPFQAAVEASVARFFR